MIVTLEQFNNGVAKYIEKEIAYKTTGLTKFIVYFAIPSIPNKISEIREKYSAFFNPYFDENGNIYIEELYKAMKVAMQKTLQFEWNGFVFKENDIDMIYNIIREQ